MFKRIIGGSAVAAAGVLLCTGLATSAFAATAAPDAPTTGSPSASTTKAPRTLAEIKARGAADTSARLTDLTKAIGKVDAAKHLTASDKSALLATLGADESAMKTLASTIAGDTTIAQASADVMKIYTGYRVLAVALPQARIVASADRLTGSTVPRLTARQQRLSALMTGKDASKSTTALQADLKDLTAQCSTVGTQTNGLAKRVLAVTPADFSSNKAVLSADKAAIKAASAAVKKAEVDVKAVSTALR